MHSCVFSTQIGKKNVLSQYSWHIYSVFVTGRCPCLRFAAGCAELQIGLTLCFIPWFLTVIVIIIVIIMYYYCCYVCCYLTVLQVEPALVQLVTRT